MLLLLLLFCHCCFAALLWLAHPVSAAAMRSQQQWHDGCWWHDSGGAAGLWLRVVVVLTIPDTKILCQGHVRVGAGMHVVRNQQHFDKIPPTFHRQTQLRSLLEPELTCKVKYPQSSKLQQF